MRSRWLVAGRREAEAVAHRRVARAFVLASDGLHFPDLIAGGTGGICLFSETLSYVFSSVLCRGC